MESCNGECKDLMEAVKEGRRAPSPANESEWGRRRRRDRGLCTEEGWANKDQTTASSAKHHSDMNTRLTSCSMSYNTLPEHRIWPFEYLFITFQKKTRHHEQRLDQRFCKNLESWWMTWSLKHQKTVKNTLAFPFTKSKSKCSALDDCITFNL